MNHRLLPWLLLPLCVAAAAQEDPDLEQGFLPKEDLGVLEFQRARPEADGRGVLVAVLDTGIDLAHPALRTTPDGKPKIVDFYDATDSGQVDLPIVRTLAEGQSELVGLTGRTLRLGTHAAAGRIFRLGRIAAKGVLPEGLAGRVKGVLDRDFREAQRKAKDRAFGGPDPAEALAPADPAFDVVAFSDAEPRWRVLVDVDADGDLGEEKALGEFRETHDVGTFPDPVQLGFAVSIAAEGRRVVVLTDGGGHGTHVAGIIGGWHGPDSPLNGLAPGVQFVAIKIGNQRMGGATSHAAMHKGIDYARRIGARVCNISFGGDSFFGDGREECARMIDEAVARWGLFVCLSAGNAGPALNTVGSPATSWRAFSIGAFCSRRTQRTNYGVLDPRRDDLFDFSSRGPLTTGSPGVKFVAPGAALSPLPTWHLKRFENWNGTSMAAPQAAGAIAVLLSAAQQEGLPASVPRVRRALTRTAKPLAELLPMEQGAGLLQVGPAYDEMVRTAGAPEPVEYRIETRNATGTGAGVYERCVLGREPFEREVRIRPDFDERTPEAVRAAFGGIWRLVSEADWIEAPAETYLNADGAEVHLRFHPARMREGLNVARVRLWALPSALPEPPELEILCTMIKPLKVEGPIPTARATWAFRPGDRRSLWLLVPPGARAARVEARETGADSLPAAYTIAMHAVTLWCGIDVASERRGISLRKDEVQTAEVEVVPGTVLEVTAFSQWRKGARVESGLDLSVRFLGLDHDRSAIDVPAGRNGGHVRVHAALGPVAARIEANLDGRLEALPFAWDVHKDPHGAEFFDGETMFEAVGRGPFEARAGERFTVDLRFDKEFLDLLDDAYYEVRDENGVIVKADHFWTGQMDFETPRNGRYELLVWVHDRGSLRLQEKGMIAPALIRRFNAIGVSVYPDLLAGFAPGANPGGEGKPIGDLALASGERRNLYLRKPDLPGPGEYVGWISFPDSGGKGMHLRVPLRIDGRPAGWPDATAARWIAREEALRIARRLARLGVVSEGEKAAGVDAAAWLRHLGAGDLDARLALAAYGLAAGEVAEGLEAEAAALIAEGHKDENARKELLAGAYVLRGELRRRAAKLPEAEADFAAARRFGGEVAPVDELEFRIRRDQGKAQEAVAAIRKASDRDPGLRRLWFYRVEAEAAAGNEERARRLVLEWLDRFPDDAEGALAAAAKAGTVPAGAGAGK